MGISRTYPRTICYLHVSENNRINQTGEIWSKKFPHEKFEFVVLSHWLSKELMIAAMDFRLLL